MVTAPVEAGLLNYTSRFRIDHTEGPLAGDVLVDIQSLSKVYLPSPLWLRTLVRTSIASPVMALDDVSFQVRRGEICAVIGPNGAGKSTLFRVLTGLTSPTSGFATVLGLHTTKESTAVRKVVGFMPADERSLWLRHTCRENLLFHARLQGVPEKHVGGRVDEMLELVGLREAADRVGFALSSGMRARLQLARALLHRPSVVILDEPTGSVDPVGSYELLELIKDITAARGLAVLLSSHRVEEIEALHHNVVMLDRGRLVHWGDLDSLRHLWGRPGFRLGFAGEGAAAGAARLLEQLPGVEVVTAEPPLITVTSSIGIGELLESLDGELGAVTSVESTTVPLREILIRVARDGGNSHATPHHELHR